MNKKYPHVHDELAIKLKGFSESVWDAVPHKEPSVKDGKWRYRVSQPYIAPEALQSVVECIKNGLISSATKPVKDFEKELLNFFKVPVAKACNSGYSAILIALKLAKIGPEDEVLMPSLTMIAVANAVSSCGALAVFVDCSNGRLNPSLSEYRNKMTKRTRAIIVTYTYGTTVDITAIKQFCDNQDLILIEDISEAIGTVCQGSLAGTVGHYAAASLYANKLVTSGDGGFVLSTITRSDIYSRASSYANHGFVPEYHFIHFEQSGNYKLSGLQAALALNSVKQIPALIHHREILAQFYRKYLLDCPGITCMEKSTYGPDAPWVFGVICQSKELRYKIRKHMAERDKIETRDFFFPIHLQPAYQSNDIEPPCLPNSEYFGKHGFYLPTHYYLSEEDIAFICDSLKTACSVED